MSSLEVDAPTPTADRAFHIETHGVDYIPPTERWAKPRDLAGMWAGASFNVEYLVYGAILMGFGFTFLQTLILIVGGNLSWSLVGLTSLQGPQAGTTTFGSNRAAFGPRGSKIVAAFNWLTMIGFEAAGLILIVGASLVLLHHAGLHASTSVKVTVVLGAVAIQAVLPVLGHASMVTVLRWLIAPFMALYIALLAYSVGHFNTALAPQHGATWQLWTAGLAFSFVLAGLSWTECGNDYSRYLPEESSSKAIVGWVIVATALPQILLMTLGALLLTAAGASFEIWNGANPFEAMNSAHFLPGWFVVLFCAISILQLFAINSLDLYSSGVTIQALGVKLKRHQAVLLDSVICLGITLYAVVSASFSTYLKDFVGLVIIWIAPWCAVYLVDWVMRGRRYDAEELQNTDASSRYWAQRGFNLRALIAQVLGMAACVVGLNTAFSVPDWIHPLVVATQADRAAGASSGADFSIPLGMGVAGLSYWLLVSIARSRAAQRRVPHT